MSSQEHHLDHHPHPSSDWIDICWPIVRNMLTEVIERRCTRLAVVLHFVGMRVVVGKRVEGYLPTTVSIYGPPGTGKTLTARRLCREFAARSDDFGVEYSDLKECLTIFSAANEILIVLGGENHSGYACLDGVFAAICERFEAYPDWTVLLLDEKSSKSWTNRSR